MTLINRGTGASCIYPLLGHRLYDWYFIASDIDPISLKYANKNIQLNKFEESIETYLNSSTSPIIKDIVEKQQSIIDFTMCNPPFFEDIEQACQNEKETCTATTGELVTSGGEFELVLKMIKESLILQNKVIWYSSLLGRKTDLKKLIQVLKDYNVVNYRSAEFCPGRTSRWALAWSFTKRGLKELLVNYVIFSFLRIYYRKTN